MTDPPGTVQLSTEGNPMTVPYYSDDLVTVHLGDCLEVMALMPDESADIVVTSPPYNMGLKPGGNGRGMYRPGETGSKAARFREGYGAHPDAMPYDEYCAWQRRVLAECWRALGVYRVWAGNPSFREMAGRCGNRAGASTFQGVLKRETLPRLELVREFLSACGVHPGYLRQFEDAWRRVAAGPG